MSRATRQVRRPAPPAVESKYVGDDKRWRAVVARDSAADGAFVYSVRSTGIYCRPNCAARLPLRKNVRFHTTCAEAERAGFRACRRCRPKDASLAAAHAAAVARVCRTIETAERMPSLDDLARAAGMSRYHFHRVFKAQTGVTPRGYAVARRAQQLREGLEGGCTVTQAMLNAGFQSNGRLYAASNESLGMTPSSFRDGGRGTTIRFATASCSLGTVLVAATERGICAIQLGDSHEEMRRELAARFQRARLVAGDPDFEQLVAAVVQLVERPALGLALPLDIRGTAFQRRVWEALRAIPQGATASYTEIARRVGSPSSVRAVAAACAANRLAVAIPCHRAVRSDGALAGYRWGIERKRELLRREREAE